MKKEQINGKWYWVSDNYPEEPYNRILIGLTPNKPRSSITTSKDIFRKMTGPERRKFLEAKDDGYVGQVYYWLLLPGDIDRTDSLVIQAFTMLESKPDGNPVLGPGRAAELLSLA